MKSYILLLSLTVLLLLPHCTYAAITINEIAWMGSSDSANDEWIELRNTGGSQNVDGWVLSDGQSLEIELFGTINGSSYTVLERTDDGSAPGGAFVIYTGALGNDGRTLTLRRDDGGIEDQVPGGENWGSVGGDNATKETAQFTENGWVTGSPTPGSSNITSGSVATDDDSNTDSTNSSSDSLASSSKAPTVQLSIPNTELALEIDAPDVAYVNQEIFLEAIPDDISPKLEPSVDYVWNYGDTYEGWGKETSHVFRYPGTYSVVVNGTFARHDAIGRKDIIVLPVTFSVTENEDSNIMIHNDAPYETDLSGFVLRGSGEVVLPAYSVLLPRATLTVARERVGFVPIYDIALYDQTGLRVARGHVSAPEPVIESFAYVSAAPGPAAQSVVSESSDERSQNAMALALLAELQSEDEVDESDAGLVAAFKNQSRSGTVPVGDGLRPSPTGTTPLFPYLGLMVVIAAGLLAIWTRRKEQ